MALYSLHLSVFLRQDRGYDVSLVNNLFSYQTTVVGSVGVCLICLIIKLTTNSVFNFIWLLAKSMKFNQTINPFTARVLDRVLQGDSNFWVCGWNPIMWPFKLKLSACTFTWCYLFVKIFENEIWKFGWNLRLATFGSERVKFDWILLKFCSVLFSLRKHPFLLVLRSWGRFSRRNVCDSATEIPYWWRKICPESGQKRWLVDGVVTLF